MEVRLFNTRLSITEVLLSKLIIAVSFSLLLKLLIVTIPVKYIYEFEV